MQLFTVLLGEKVIFKNHRIVILWNLSLAEFREIRIQTNIKEFGGNYESDEESHLKDVELIS